MEIRRIVRPHWQSVKTPESSQTKEIAYDPEGNILYVNFRSNNSVYQYFPVTKDEFDNLVDSRESSLGAYLHKHFNKSRKGLTIIKM